MFLFCQKTYRETFLYKIDVLGLMGLIVDSFDVWCESGWLSDTYIKVIMALLGEKNLLLFRITLLIYDVL